MDRGISLELNRRTWTSPRIERIDAFRRSPFSASGGLVATTPCLAEGLNIPEASVVVFLDYDWVPSVMAQAFSLLPRHVGAGARRARPLPDLPRHNRGVPACRQAGMELLCDCKRKAIAEGLARLMRDDFRLPARLWRGGPARHQSLPRRVGAGHQP